MMRYEKPSIEVMFLEEYSNITCDVGYSGTGSGGLEEDFEEWML